jgi:peptidyl-prolyl cis-trans isomerase SurA
MSGSIMLVLRRLIVGSLALLALLLAGQPARSADEQRIAAVVNDDVITVRDLNERLQLVMLTSGIRDSEQARSRLAPQVLRGLVEETLQLQEAKRLNLEVDQSEIDNALNTIAKRNKLSVDQMKSLLVHNGINLETLVRQVRAQIAWLKVVNRTIKPNVTVTVDQLDLAVQEARDSQGQPEYLLSEIVLPVDNPAQADKVAQDAQRLVQTLREGANFDSLAHQVSAAASAERGGDLGWVSAATIPPELQTMLDRMRPGDFSDPLSSPIGYHIFWLRDQRIAAAPVNSDRAAVEVKLTQILFPSDGSAAANAEARDRAAGLRARLTDCPAMAAVASEIKAPASGDLGWLKVGDLPPDLGKAVLGLQVGELSPPLPGPAGVHLLMVCDRRDPQGVTPEREQIAQRLEQERADRLARRYLRDLRKQAFIDLRI